MYFQGRNIMKRSFLLAVLVISVLSLFLIACGGGGGGPEAGGTIPESYLPGTYALTGVDGDLYEDGSGDYLGSYDENDLRPFSGEMIFGNTNYYQEICLSGDCSSASGAYSVSPSTSTTGTFNFSGEVVNYSFSGHNVTIHLPYQCIGLLDLCFEEWQYYVKTSDDHSGVLGLAAPGSEADLGATFVGFGSLLLSQ
jgi:hypothetical protein